MPVTIIVVVINKTAATIIIIVLMVVMVPFSLQVRSLSEIQVRVLCACSIPSFLFRRAFHIGLRWGYLEQFNTSPRDGSSRVEASNPCANLEEFSAAFRRIGAG